MGVIDGNTPDQNADIAVRAGGSGLEKSAGLRAEHVQIAVSSGPGRQCLGHRVWMWSPG
jgi:hypothetical protein